MDLVGPQTGVIGPYVQSGIGRSAHFVITRNGGRTFRAFGPAASNQDIPDSVFFRGGVRDGWLLTFPGGGGSDAEYRTPDGGRTWRRMRIPAPRRAIFGLPAVFGTTVIETATTAAGRAVSLLTFVSRNDGASWRQGSGLDRAGAGDGCSEPVSASFPSASAGWAAAFRAGRSRSTAARPPRGPG